MVILPQKQYIKPSLFYSGGLFLTLIPIFGREKQQADQRTIIMPTIN